MASRKKMAAALIMILVVGALVALIPTVASKILGSHTWYKSPQCTACHKKEVTEIGASTTVNGPHYNGIATSSQCVLCHSGQCVLCHYAGEPPALDETICHLANRSLALCGSRMGCHDNKPEAVKPGVS